MRTTAMIIKTFVIAVLLAPALQAEPSPGRVPLPAVVRVQVPPGMKVGDPMRAPSLNQRGQGKPRVAFGQGVYLLVWEDGFSGLDGKCEILGMRIAPDGTPREKTPIRISQGGVSCTTPDVAAFRDRFLVTWAESNADGYAIHAALIGADGRVLPPGQIAVAIGVGAQINPVVATDGQNSALVVWQAYEKAGPVMRGMRIASDGSLLDKAPLELHDKSGRPFVVWNGAAFLTGYRWNYGLVGADGTRLRPFEAAWQSKTAGDGVAAQAWGRTHLFFDTEPHPDPWGWGGNGAIIGVSIAPDGATSERERAGRLRNLQATTALGQVENCLDAARWRNHAGWPMGMRGGLKSTHNNQWPSGRPAAAYNGRSLLVVWPRATLVGNKSLRNRDLYLARVLPGWGTVDAAPVCLVGSPDEEAHPALAAGLAGHALLAYERVPAAGPAVEFRALIEAEDRTPPRVEYVVSQAPTEWVVAFDEPVDAESLQREHFQLAGVEILGVELQPDARGRQREALLRLAAPPATEKPYTLTVSGVCDRSPAGNAQPRQLFEFIAKPGRMQRGQFIDRWLLLGPLPRDTEKHPFDPQQVVPRHDADVRLSDGRTMAWRSVAGEVLDLGRIFNEDPAQMCYAGVSVFSERPRRVVIRLDTNDHNRLWVNGRLVQDGITGAPESRGFHDYADETPVELMAGWNALLVQVENRVTTWMLSGQITDETGEPLRDLTYDVGARE